MRRPSVKNEGGRGVYVHLHTCGLRIGKSWIYTPSEVFDSRSWSFVANLVLNSER